MSANGMTLGEYDDLMRELVDSTQEATEAFVDTLRSNTATAQDKLFAAAAYHANLLAQAQHVAGNYATRALVAGNEAAAAAAARVSAWAANLASQYDGQNAIAFEKALATEIGSGLSKAAGGALLGLEALDYANELAGGDYDEAAKKLAQFTLSLLLTPLLAGFVSGLGLALIPGALVAFGIMFAAVGLLSLAWPHLPEGIRDFFNIGQAWFQRRDPLTLDLDGDGIENTGVNQNNPILFDHDGDGVKHATGWISSDDGLVVLDRNGNGTIDSGRELFGDSTQLPNGQNAEDGFAALAAEDTNVDGAVTAADTRFNQLRVWRDLNQDGESQTGELFTLQQLGIVSINVSSVEHNQPLPNGNRLADLGTYVRSDGSEGTVGETHGSADIDLAEDTFYREFPDEVPLAEGVTDLPKLAGSGLVRDLWEAASLSTDLRGLLEQFSEATTRAEQLALIDQLLVEWAKTAGMDSMEVRAHEDHFGLRWQEIGSSVNMWTGFMHAAPGGGTTGNSGGNPGSMQTQEEIQSRIAWELALTRTRNLFTVLEAFNGRYFFALPDDPFAGAAAGIRTFTWADPDDPGSGGSVQTYPVLQLTISQAQLEALNASYEVLRESVYSGLALQTRLQPLIDMIVFAPDPNGSGLVLDFEDLEGELQDRIQQNAVDGMADLFELTRGMSRQLAGTAWNGWQLIDQNIRSLPSTPEVETLYAQFGVHVANGTVGLNGNGRSNILLGSASGESISGEGGDDALIAGEGGDNLYGGEGSDSLLGQGGNDGLYGGAGADALEGGTGNDHLRGETGNDIYVFRRGDGQDTIDNYDTTADRSDLLRMGPGIGANDVRLTLSGTSLVVSIRGTTDRVTINGFFESDHHAINGIALADGEYWDLDTIKEKVQFGTAGNDHLVGHDSGSALYGLGGDDLLEGGAGEDLLEDWWGANVLRGGAGADTINGTGTIEGGTGDDVITGGGGHSADTYLFNAGDGHDTINESSYGFVVDTLRFGAGIAPAGVTLVRSGNDLTFRISETDQVTVKNWFADPYYHAIERVQFADGTTWDVPALQALVPQQYVGTEEGETIAGWEGIDIIDGAGGNDTINTGGANDQLSGGAGNDTLNAGYGNDSLSGGAGNDILNGESGDDVLDGGADNDTLTDWWGANVLRGGAGADTINGTGTIEGGTGDDVITGGGGHSADTYLFNAGDGHDTIIESSYGFVVDTLSFGAGITPAGVTLARSGDDLVFVISATDQIAVKNWFLDPYYCAIERVQFADGTTWDVPALQALMPAQYVGTEAGETIQGWEGVDIMDGAGGNDTINGYGANDQLSGGAGNDTINAGYGNDVLSGGAGNDILNGESGDDVLDGGADNDTLTDWWGANVLRGGAGNDTINGTGTIEGGTGDDVITGGGGYSADTYLFNVGDGHDTINESSYGHIVDTLSFGAGIAAAGVTLVRSGNDLTFRVSETDQVTVKNWFADPYYHAIERVQFTDGTTWDMQALQALTPTPYVGSEAGETIVGWEGIDLIDGGGGNDTINAGGANDQLSGGEGNDTINAGYGNDLLSGDAGNDILNGESGDDILEGGADNDTLTDWWGANVLRGGAGADTINGAGTIEGGTGDDVITGAGGYGADTYIFNLGDGHDTIIEQSYGFIVDTLSFGAGITPAGVALVRSGNDLTFKISETDQVTVKNWFLDPYYCAIERVQFADGTAWDMPALQALTPAPYVGSEAGETIVGWEGIDIIDGAGGNDTINTGGANDQLSGGDGNDTLNAGYGNDQLSGGAGNDILNGESGDDVLEGGADNDTLTDGWGANILRGGAGNDTINGAGTIEGGTGDDVLTGAGGYGADTYIFNVGDGHDTIIEQSYGFIVDTLSFGAGITPAGVTLVRSGNDLTFRISATDQVTVKNWFLDPYYCAIERVQFADGAFWDVPAMQALVPTPYTASEAGETIVGWEGIDIIDGAGGNDTINTGGANDQLSGGDGNDTLNAGAGNDLLSGGTGNDILNGEGGDDLLEGGADNDTLTDWWGANVLRGGAGADTINGTGTIEGGTGDDVLTGAGGYGADTYIFNVGDGHDTIIEQSYGFIVDTLSFGAGITPAGVTLVRSGNDLTFRVSETDQVTVKNWFLDPYYCAIERVQFADGTFWDVPAMQALVPAPYTASEAGETILGWEGIDIIDGAGGNDTINAGGANDQLSGGEGNDTINAGAGNDLLSGGAGNDILNGEGGDDLLEGGADNDTLTDWSGVNVLRGGAGADILNGIGTLEGGAGDDVLTGGGGYSADTYIFNVGDGHDTINESSYGFVVDTLNFGTGITPAGVTLVRSGNDLTFKMSETDQVTVKNWFLDPFYCAIERVQFADGTTWDVPAMQALIPALYVASEAGETIQGWEGIDIVDGAGGNDALNGYSANDFLAGGAGADQINGGNGIDIMQGGADADTLIDYTGNNLFDGGAGNDALQGGAGRDLIIGGAGNDSIGTGEGADVIAFARNDGADVVVATAGGGDTLSLGGGIEYADLSLRKNGNDLILDAGSGDQITFRDWYAWAGYQSVVNLQMVAEAMSSFAPGGSDPLLDNSIERFNFLGLVSRFDQARAADPGLTAWALSNALLDFHTSGSDSAAIGGDLAYQHGLNRNLTGIGLAPAQAALNDAQFATQAQTLHALGSLQTGAVRLA